MNSPHPYAYRVFSAIGDAITDVSTDSEARSVTYHRREAARACLLMAASIVRSEAEGAPPLTAVEIDELVAAEFGNALARLASGEPHHVLDAGRADFTTRTLA